MMLKKQQVLKRGLFQHLLLNNATGQYSFQALDYITFFEKKFEEYNSLNLFLFRNQ